MKANLVYVMGEVAKPNYYLMEGPNSVSQIIARAGGFFGILQTKVLSWLSAEISTGVHGEDWLIL